MNIAISRFGFGIRDGEITLEDTECIHDQILVISEQILDPSKNNSVERNCLAR